jgi:hypothetical protein
VISTCIQPRGPAAQILTVGTPEGMTGRVRPPESVGALGGLQTAVFTDRRLRLGTRR